MLEFKFRPQICFLIKQGHRSLIARFISSGHFLKLKWLKVRRKGKCLPQIPLPMQKIILFKKKNKFYMKIIEI